jgi:hypothetical protein
MSELRGTRQRCRISIPTTFVLLSSAFLSLGIVPVYQVELGPGVSIVVYGEVIAAEKRASSLSVNELRDKIQKLKMLAQRPGDLAREPKVELLGAYLVLRGKTLTSAEEDAEIFALSTRDPTIIASVQVPIRYYKSFAADLQKQLRAGTVPVPDKTGLILGFLEADPATEVKTFKIPGNAKISRSFKAFSTEVPIDVGAVYAIKIVVDQQQTVPSGTRFKMISDETQSIFEVGKPQTPTWTIEFSADKEFGQATLSLTAELLKFDKQADWDARKTLDKQNRTTIAVPISRPIFKPEGDKSFFTDIFVPVWVPIIAAIIAGIGGASASLINLARRRHRHPQPGVNLAACPHAQASATSPPTAEHKLSAADTNLPRGAKPEAATQDKPPSTAASQKGSD